VGISLMNRAGPENQKKPNPDEHSETEKVHEFLCNCSDPK